MSDRSIKNFIDFLKQSPKNKILLYVYADWCDKCNLDKTKIKNIPFYLINVDKSDDLIDILDIRIVPYFMLISYDYKNNDIIVHETFDNVQDVYNFQF